MLENTEEYFSYKNFVCSNEHLLYLNVYPTDEIWVSNGQPNDSFKLDVQVSNGPDFKEGEGIQFMIANGNKLYFRATNEDSGSEIYFATIDFSALGVDDYSSIKDNKTKEQITVYPNPTNEFIHIRSLINNKIQSIEVFNLLGERIIIQKNRSGSSEMTYNISKLIRGIYLIKIHLLNGNTKTSKLIIR